MGGFDEWLQEVCIGFTMEGENYWVETLAAKPELQSKMKTKRVGFQFSGLLSTIYRRESVNENAPSWCCFRSWA